MDLRSQGRKLPFAILRNGQLGEEDDGEESQQVNGFRRSNSDPVSANESKSPRKKRKHKKRKKNPAACAIIPESPQSDHRKVTFFGNGNGHVANGMEFYCKSYSAGLSQVTVVEAPAVECQSNHSYGVGELRQRSVGNNVAEQPAVTSTRAEISGEEDKDMGFKVGGKQLSGEMPGSGIRGRLETAESLDWKQVMSEDPNCLFEVERSPIKYFMEEMRVGNALRSTTTLGNEKERDRVYDTIFRLPWRCELLIDVGVFVCFDSFLSLLTIMPARIFTVLWRFLKMRQLKLSAAELSDLGCLIVLLCGIGLLQQTDISLIYHMIRGQGTIKLYVVYNVLEIFDKLCQNFGGDVLQTLFSSAEGLASCLPDNQSYWKWRFGSDLALAVAASIIHSFILLAQAITLSTCIVAHNNALFALLVSNNFAEIKSNVFKRFSKENIHSIVYYDSIERFHITAFVLFVLAQNIREAEGPWFESFLFNAMLVYICEMAIDIIKHSFIAKFNDIKPIAYSEFLEELCRQTLNFQTNTKNNLTFVPLAPACVVIRVLTPVYADHLPYSPFLWRLFWIFILFAMTYFMLASLKVMVRMGLQKHAAWYVKRCEKRKLHSD